MKKIVVFASGEGTNAQAIINHFNNSSIARVIRVYCNNPVAGVLRRAQSEGVATHVFDRTQLSDGTVTQWLVEDNPDLIVLAGFLWLFPSSVIGLFPKKIVNIHPALLPKYGGKGMYGMNVHRAVKENQESETGITIHHVDEHYDEGDVIFQIAIKLSGDESPEQIAERIHELEHEHFPKVIENLLK